jgi:hypothetical protein
MFEGGSLVYFDKLFSPEKLVGVDIRREPIPSLEDYRAARPHIKTYYGRAQERPGTRAAAQANFPNGIDLIVDDASHAYENTAATFVQLFPLLKTGGFYVIEDWGWAHRAGYQVSGSTWHDKPALTNLIFALTVMVASLGVIKEITINRHLACIQKGPGALPATKLELRPYLRGREMPLI